MGRAVTEKYKLLGYNFVLLWRYDSKIPNPPGLEFPGKRNPEGLASLHLHNLKDPGKRHCLKQQPLAT